MASPVPSDLTFLNSSRILDLPDAASDQEPMTLAQGRALINGLKFKTSCRAKAGGNINLSAPGSSIGAVTMVLSDRFLADLQTDQTQNGYYIYNGPSTPATRTLDADTFVELEAAVVSIEEGTYAKTTWRQTEVNGVIGVNNIIFEPFDPEVPAATTTIPGVARIATQADVDTGLVADEFVTPETLGAWSGRTQQLPFLVGDTSNTSYNITHNFNSYNISVEAWETGGNRRQLSGLEVRKPNTNQITVVFSSAPATDAYLILVRNR